MSAGEVLLGEDWGVPVLGTDGLYAGDSWQRLNLLAGENSATLHGGQQRFLVFGNKGVEFLFRIHLPQVKPATARQPHRFGPVAKTDFEQIRERMRRIAGISRTRPSLSWRALSTA